MSIQSGGGGGPMTMGMAQTKASPRKLKMVEGNWFVFEENEKIWISHFCSGKPEHGEKQRAPWFHRGENVDKTDKCSSCEEEIPKNLYMMAKIQNCPQLS